MITLTILICTIVYFIHKHEKRKKEGYDIDQIDILGNVVKEKETPCEVISEVELN